MNRTAKVILRLIVKIILFIIIWCAYRSAVNGDIIITWTSSDGTIAIFIGIVIYALIDSIVNEIHVLDPNKEIYDKLSKGTWNMYKDVSNKTKQLRK